MAKLRLSLLIGSSDGSEGGGKSSEFFRRYVFPLFAIKGQLQSAVHYMWGYSVLFYRLCGYSGRSIFLFPYNRWLHCPVLCSLRSQFPVVDSKRL